jgi:hypothetical protein
MSLPYSLVVVDDEMKRANSYRKICLQRFVFNSAICFTDSLLLTFDYCYKQNRKLCCIIIASLWILNSNLGFDKDNKSNQTSDHAKTNCIRCV